MNNHASIHRNAKVNIVSNYTTGDAVEKHYQGIIVSADNIGVTLSGATTVIIRQDYEHEDCPKDRELRAEFLAERLKERQRFGTFFLPWSSIAVLEVL